MQLYYISLIRSPGDGHLGCSQVFTLRNYEHSCTCLLLQICMSFPRVHPSEWIVGAYPHKCSTLGGRPNCSPNQLTKLVLFLSYLDYSLKSSVCVSSCSDSCQKWELLGSSSLRAVPYVSSEYLDFLRGCLERQHFHPKQWLSQAEYYRASISTAPSRFTQVHWHAY